jgi:hypothetical protein
MQCANYLMFVVPFETIFFQELAHNYHDGWILILWAENNVYIDFFFFFISNSISCLLARL